MAGKNRPKCKCGKYYKYVWAIEDFIPNCECPIEIEINDVD